MEALEQIRRYAERQYATYRNPLGRETTDAETNTGGVGWRPPKPKAPDTLEKIVNCIRISYPVLKASKVDNMLRSMLLAELIQATVSQQQTIFLPEGATYHVLPTESFKKLREVYSGVTRDNVEQIAANIKQLITDAMPVDAPPMSVA